MIHKESVILPEKEIKKRKEKKRKVKIKQTMPPKSKKTATASTQQTNSKKANAEDAAQQQQPSKETVVPLPQTLAKIPSEQTAASFLFGSATATATSKATTTSSSTDAPQTFSSLKTQASQLNSIDEVIVNNNGNKKNSFLMAVEASLTASKKNSSSSSSSLSFDQVVELLNKFLQQTSSALSANSFMYVLYLLVIASGTTASENQKQNHDDEIQLMRALAQMLKTCSMRLELRGSVSDAAKAIFSNSSGTTISSTAFRLCLQLLIAAIENGRHGNVALLSSVLDGIACAQSQNIQPQSLLRDAAQLLTSLEKFATVGSPRLRGLVSAWNAPMLPAKKEAMVVKGNAYKIDVSPIHALVPTDP